MLSQLSSFVTKGRSRLRSLSRFAAAMVRVTGEVLRAHVRVDLQLAAIVLVYLTAFVPIIPRATESPQALRCCIDDEAPLSMALDGMRVLPYGDPFNFVLAPTKGVPLPTYWDQFNYAGSGYHYGGLYFGLAFLAYGPMEVLGFPPFPTVPIILRTLSILAGLLALLITYNFALMQIGRVAAVVSTLILLTDTYFIHYAIIIHPDGLQFALALLTLAVAARHVTDGELESLGALGFLSGLIQGTKMGGPWLIPLAALALVEGIRRRHDLPRAAIMALILRRGFLLLVLSIVAYFVSTPYAFLSPDFIIENSPRSGSCYEQHFDPDECFELAVRSVDAFWPAVPVCCTRRCTVHQFRCRQGTRQMAIGACAGTRNFATAMVYAEWEVVGRARLYAGDVRGAGFPRRGER